MKIDEMKASREMDALVAEKVMGLKFPWGMNHYMLSGGGPYWVPNNYSTSIAAAWEVWGKITKEDKGSWAIYGNADGTVEIQHFPEDYLGELEKSCGNDLSEDGPFPLAICRAALKAVGYDNDAAIGLDTNNEAS